MTSAVNPQTGEILVLGQNGQWAPPKIAVNPETNERLFLDGGEWKAVPQGAKTPPQRTFGDNVGLGARAVMSGLGAVPGLVYDAARGVINAPVTAYNLATGSNAQPIVPKSAQENISAAADAVGLPSPETRGERILSRGISEAAGMIPTMGTGLIARGAQGIPSAVRSIASALSAEPASQFAAGAGSGLAAQLAKEEGVGPIGEAGAALAGALGGATAAQGAQAVGRGLKASAEPFTRAGQEKMTADVLLRQSSRPETLERRLADGLSDQTRRLPGSPVTTAQAARDPGLAVMENALRADVGRSAGQVGAPGSVAFRDADAGRNLSRLSALEGMQDKSTALARGAVVRGTLDKAETAARQGVRQAFNDVDPDNTTAVALRPIGQGMFDAASKRFGPGSGGVPANVQAALDEIKSAPARVNFQWLQNMRSRLGEESGKARMAGDARAAATFGEMRAALESGVERAAQSGSGFTPAQATAWKGAVAKRSEMGAAFGRDEGGAKAVMGMIAKDRFGRPTMADEKVADQAISSAANLSQVLRAAGKESIAVRDTLRGHFAEKMLEASKSGGQIADASGNVAQALSPQGFLKFMAKNDAVADKLFGQAQKRILKQLVNDFSETQLAAQMGRARGSDTAQNISVANFIARATNGLIDPASPLAQTVGSLGGVLRLVYSAPEAAVREMVIEAARDPVFASKLLAKATPQSMEQAAAYVTRTMGDRLAKIAEDALVRQGARSVTSATLQE